ncbi:MAG: thiamine diphosphokinase [Anaerolineaceae bacterium]|nr:thiamine diphosphokinase [Anaerolineaceae bacterium]
MPQFERAVLFVNGEMENPDHLSITKCDYLVAVDNGMRHLVTLNLTPHLLIGDLDSIDPDHVEFLQAKGVEIRRFPPEKDQTDLELALELVIQKGFTRILMVAALGGRLDQTLANIALLGRDDLKDIDIRMEDGLTSVFIVRNESRFDTSPGDTISLLPLGTPVSGITTHGLAYPLEKETLYPHQTRGISNTAIADEVSIKKSQGNLLCIHTKLRLEE